MSANRQGTHRIGLHHGESLFTLANTYHTLLLTIVEAVQNAIDADAEVVFVGVNRQKSQVIVIDDGLGVTMEKFQEALLSIGKGIKKAGSLGRFGLGLISPLNKCQRFVFTSFPVGSRTGNQWTFIGEDIRQHANVEIPFKELARIPAVPQPFSNLARKLPATWRTMVQLVDVTQDRTISTVDVDELSAHIRTKLGQAMRRKRTTVHVAIYDEKGNLTTTEINPVEFTGEKLPVITYDDEDHCGKVIFELYRASRTGGTRRGEVVVVQLDDNYPIQWREFAVQAMGSRWLTLEATIKDAFNALGSGYFEGTIYVENIELAPERTKFVLNDALKASYIAIYRWFKDHGRAQFESEQETRRGQRYQRLGEQSLERIYALLGSDAAFSAIDPNLSDSAILTGSPERKAAKPKERPSAHKPKRRRVVAKPPMRSASGTSSREPRDESKKPVMLTFAFEAMPQSKYVWEFDHDTATLIFNIIHHVWIMCDEGEHGKRTTKHDRQIMHLQEWVALKLLMLLTQHPDPEELAEVRWMIDQEVRPYAAAFILR